MMQHVSAAVGASINMIISNDNPVGNIGKLAIQTMLLEEFQSKVTGGAEFDHLFRPYWIILLWMREGALLRKQWPF